MNFTVWTWTNQIQMKLLQQKQHEQIVPCKPVDLIFIINHIVRLLLL